MRRTLLLCLACFFIQPYVVLASTSRDAALSASLKGVWESSPESIEKEYVIAGFNFVGLEIFDDHGEGRNIVFKEKLCGSVAFKMSFKWRIENGILITTEENGKVLHDEIVLLEGDVLKLHSIEDQVILQRHRRGPCV